MEPISGVKACVFDAYGTLFDFASAARKCRDVLGLRVEPKAFKFIKDVFNAKKVVAAFVMRPGF